MSVTIDPVPESAAPPARRTILAANALFRGLDEETLAAICNVSEVHRLAARATLYSQNDAGGRIFFLTHGSMKLTRRSDLVREHVVRLVRPGELLAESQLFSARVYPTTAVALEDSRLISTDAREFAVQLHRDPRLAWNVMERLGRRIDQLEIQTDLLATHTAEQKVAAYLTNGYRARSGSDAVVPTSCRRSDLASFLALAPETLCRVIAQFKRRGWIRSQNGEIVITNLEALSAVAPE